MSLPFILPPGCVSVYGLGSERGLSGIIPNDTKYKFASIYSVSMGGAVNFYQGQSVMFNIQEIKYVLRWNGWPYTVIEEKNIGGIEEVAL